MSSESIAINPEVRFHSSSGIKLQCRLIAEGLDSTQVPTKPKQLFNQFCS